MKPNIIKDKSFEFSLAIIQLFKSLQANKEFIISRQLLRSATSIGANVVEAQAAYSRREFASKMSIAFKEASETKYWLELLGVSDFTPISVEPYLLKVNELLRILATITKTVHNRSEEFN